LVGLVATVTSTGGTLTGGSTWFYAVSAIDSGGGESQLSFIVQASTGAGSNTSVIGLAGIGLPVGAASFNVYRGMTPQQLFRIASSQAPATTFTDTGLPQLTILPPDPDFDHVDLYWRWELVPEAAVTLHSATTVGNGVLELPVININRLSCGSPAALAQARSSRFPPIPRQSSLFRWRGPWNRFHQLLRHRREFLAHR